MLRREVVTVAYLSPLYFTLFTPEALLLLGSVCESKTGRTINRIFISNDKNLLQYFYIFNNFN